MADVIYVNGRITAPPLAQISAHDRGFLYGDALFETMRARTSGIVRLDAHLVRLAASAEFLGFDLSSSNNSKNNKLIEFLNEILSAENLE